ncbi:hypothetical protein BH24BAC1_BH24BAC1_24940 [soil metagenome]
MLDFQSQMELCSSLMGAAPKSGAIGSSLFKEVNSGKEGKIRLVKRIKQSSPSVAESPVFQGVERMLLPTFLYLGFLFCKL